MSTPRPLPARYPLINLIIALTLALIPPALVTADRWFHLLYKDLGRDVWCESFYSFGSCLPPYFLTINLCLIGLLVFMFFQSRAALKVEIDPAAPQILPVSHIQTRLGQTLMLGATAGFALIVLLRLRIHQLPGWGLVTVWLVFLAGSLLKTFSLGNVLDFLKTSGSLWVSLLLTHLALIAVLREYFEQSRLIWAASLFLLLTLVNLWRFRRRIPIIFGIVSLALIVYSINLNGWWTAFIGDDDVFYDYALHLAQTNFSELGQFLFRADGVYGTHPYFSSLLQALSIKLLGSGNFGWRFGSLYLSALGVGLFYLFCKAFLSKRLALIAAFLLAVSAYIMSFGKIGYNNLQALFAMTLVLALAGRALRSGLQLAFVLLGSSLAFCFYVYPAALYVIPLPILLLGLYHPPLTRTTLKQWLVMIAVALALIYPLMLQPVYWQAKLAGTLINRPDLLQSFTAIFYHLANNLIYAFYGFLYIPRETHFVASSYLDPLSAVFFLLGFCALVYQIRRQRLALFIFITLIFFLVTVGASHDRETPPTTRMFLFLPLYALVAAWGLAWIGEQARQIFPSRGSILSVAIAILLVAIAGANLYQAYPLSHARSRYLSQSQFVYALFVRVSQNLQQTGPELPKNYLFIADQPWDEIGLAKFKTLYPQLAQAKIQQIFISGPELSKVDLASISERGSIVIFTPWLNPDWVTALDAQLVAAGKEACQIAAPGREASLTIYYAPDLQQACQP